MGWFHIDDQFHTHPKAHAAGNAAIGAWTMLGSFASAHGLDGFVPERQARGYASRAELRRLVDVGLLEHVAESDGWPAAGFIIHDYLDANPSALDRAVARERTRRWRANRKPSRDTARDTARDTSRDSKPAPAPAPRSELEHAAAAVPTVAGPAAAALDLYTDHRIQAEGRKVRSTSKYAATIRRDELVVHGVELAAIATDADPIDVAVAVFGMTKSDAIRAQIRRENSLENLRNGSGKT